MSFKEILDSNKFSFSYSLAMFLFLIFPPYILTIVLCLIFKVNMTFWEAFWSFCFFTGAMSMYYDYTLK